MSEILRTVSAFTVIAGTVLVVVQVRVHARNANSRNAFDLIARVTDPSFARRRHQLYEVAENRAGGDWTGFDRSQQDLSFFRCEDPRVSGQHVASHLAPVAGLAASCAVVTSCDPVVQHVRPSIFSSCRLSGVRAKLRLTSLSV